MSSTPQILVPATVPCKAYLAASESSGLHEGDIKRRPVLAKDVGIKILYCGICHSDLHALKNDWGRTVYPLVAGHEIVGVVEQVGSEVTRFKVGQKVGVGCLVDSCRACKNCQAYREQNCFKSTLTYGGKDLVSGGQTMGGYSEKVVVNEDFVLSIPDGLDLASAAPLLCAGITVYTPLVENKIGKGKKVGVLGIGGLGSVALQIALAMGATVVAFTSSASKKEELAKLGVSEVVITSNRGELKKHQNSLDLIIDTVSAAHDILPLISTLALDGIYHVLGAPVTPFEIPAAILLFKNIKITGSLIGSIARTQEMLNLCAKHGVKPLIEIGQLKDINTLLERLEKGDVRYRFVLDIGNAFRAKL